MKNSNLIIAGLAFASLTFSSCKNEKKEGESTTVTTTTKTNVAPEGDHKEVDVTQSFVEWRGYKLLKTEQTSHYGKINFESGHFIVKDGKLVGGNFAANMASLNSEDLKGSPEDAAKLEGHLKSADFFDVTKYPTSSFEITEVLPQTTENFNSKISGNLTVHGVTKPVSFDANVTVSPEGVVSLKTKPTDINRNDFGVTFKSPAENGVIKDEITLQISAVSKK